MLLGSAVLPRSALHFQPVVLRLKAGKGRFSRFGFSCCPLCPKHGIAGRFLSVPYFLVEGHNLLLD